MVKSLFYLAAHKKEWLTLVLWGRSGSGGEGKIDILETCHVITTSQWKFKVAPGSYNVAFWSNYSCTFVFHKVWSSTGSPTASSYFFAIAFSQFKNSHMAKASSLADSLGKELECAVCLEQYKEPKVLPCLHSFCKKCLEGLLPKQTTEKGSQARRGRRRRGVPPRSQVVREIKCPSCRKSVEVS